MGVIRFAIAGLLVLVWTPDWALAHRGHDFGSPFHAASLTKACKLAEDEFKVAFVYVTEPKGRAPAYLERPSWDDWRTIDLLLRETVAVKLDQRRNADELRRYDLRQLPAVLLLNPDGTERRRFAGDLSAVRLMRELAADLSGEESVARVRKAVQSSGGEDPIARERLAEALTRRGAFADALEAYLWCLDVGLRKYIPYAASRRRLLLKGFVTLAEQYPQARRTLADRRKAMEQTLLTERDDVNLVRDLAELNRCLNDEPRSLWLYDRLPPKSKARYVLFDRVIGQLVEHKRYDEVLAILDPMRTFEEEARFARLRGAPQGEGPEARRERGTRAFAVARGAELVEALAGSSRMDEARDLADRIIELEDTPETRALLKRHAQNAGSRQLIKYIESRPTKP